MIFSVVGAVVVGGGSFKCAINIDLCEKSHVCIQITGGEREWVRDLQPLQQQ